MALTLSRAPDSSGERARPGPDTRASRLAELVVHLTGCEPEGALDAVTRQDRSPTTPDAALGVVAEAMLSVSRPPALRVADDGDDRPVEPRRVTSRHDLQCPTCRRTHRPEHWAPAASWAPGGWSRPAAGEIAHQSEGWELPA